MSNREFARYIQLERYDRSCAAIAGYSSAIRLEGMDTDRSSWELLGHFDRPKRVVSPDFDWDETDCGVAEFDPAAAVDSEITGYLLEARCAQLDVARCSRRQPPGSVITAVCVLKWAAAVVILA